MCDTILSSLNYSSKCSQPHSANTNASEKCTSFSLKVPAMDWPTLATINCKLSSSFVVNRDGSGAFFSVLGKYGFTFVNFETGQKTDLSVEDFKTLKGEFTVHSTALFDEFLYESPDTTVFVGLLYERERPSQKVYCILFCANVKEKSVSIIDEADTNWTGTSAFYSYIYKSRCGKCFALKFMPVDGVLLVSHILMTSTKLNVREVVRQEHLASFRDHSLLLPFVEDDAVYFFANDRSDKLSIFSFNGTQSSTSVTTSNGKFLKSSEFPKPVYYDGHIFYCTYEGNDTIIWSLNMQKFCWSRRAKIRHHQRKWSQRNSLEILPDGTTFIHIKCNDCDDTSHLYQLDLSVHFHQHFYC